MEKTSGFKALQNHIVFKIKDQYAKWKAIYGRRRTAKMKTLEAGMLWLAAPFGHQCAATEPTTGANVSPWKAPVKMFLVYNY